MSLPASSHTVEAPEPAAAGQAAAPAQGWADAARAELRIDAEIALAALVAALGACAYTRVYGGRGFLPVVAGAAALPALLVALARRTGWPTRRGLVLAVVAAGPYAIATVYRSATTGGLPGPAAWSALAHGALHGWAQMLSVGLPADARGDLLVTPALLVWLASALAAWLVVSTASPLAPLGPLVVSFVLGLALAAAGGGPPPAMTALVLGTALLLVLLRAGRLAAAGVERARLSGASIVGASHPAGPAEPRRPARRRGGAGVRPSWSRSPW